MEKLDGSEPDDFSLAIVECLESVYDGFESDDYVAVKEEGREVTEWPGSLSSLSIASDQYINARCEPVIEILDAKIYTHDNVSLDVYGDIRIFDLKEGSTNDFIVYERDLFDSPQHISPLNRFLQLSSPGEIPFYDDPHLAVDIKNVRNDAVIACGQKPLFKTTHHPFKSGDFENLYTLQFQGDAGAFVEVQCLAFTFGVYAEVEIVLLRDSVEDEGEEDGKGVEVFGLICAKCDPLILPKNCYTNNLFNVIQEEREWVALGTEIGLSKSLLPVPAYSPLEISLDLRGNDGIIVNGTASFEASNYSGKKYIRGLNGFYVWVHVDWCEPSLLTRLSCNEDRIDGFCSVPHWPSLYASQLLEVFSLFISRPNEEEVNLYGSVNILDSRGWCSIFSCSKKEAYCLSRGSNFLPVRGPTRAITPGYFFSMEIDLRDVDGHVNIQGYVASSPLIGERQRPWFDRRLRSVVKSVNEKSFAAVNYTLFSFAVLAIIEVRLVFHRGSFAHVKIYGDITASLGKLLYSTTYDVEFFQRVLFTRKKENFLEVEDNLKLSTNHVAVPMDSSLLTKVNLSLQTSVHTHHLAGLVKFQIGEPCKVIKSDFVDICIDVKWKGLPYV
ncbi:hypothetical protein DCAR_0105024 [Daucus carota subsp. sativus]|uniref:DUF6598 domain-containing protein n=1 Tax=Daucus carota subsp. sativus TaxID=79200 RepID=A0A162BAG6_DAUCS|nr:PREDICTED: uncharacterized protein LOC108223716 [Daucus carota subsp. sativus]WOG85831.1 hypothetical protein DCAR_0105024 [Daucus carota subsp. sativus]